MSMTQQTLTDGSFDEHRGEEQCPDCGRWFKYLGQHWRYNPEHRPCLSGFQKELIKGHLLGDGGYEKSRGYFQLQNMATKPYLDWLSEQFGVLSNKITQTMTPEESVQHHIDTGFRENPDVDNYKNLFTYTTKPHPQLGFCKDWYDGGEIVFPNGLSLTPTILRTWYISDGGLVYEHGKYSRVSIANHSQIHRVDYIKSLFSDIGFDVIINDRCITIRGADKDEFFDFMGSPPTDGEDGFSYKWAYEDCQEYHRLKDVHNNQPYLD